MGIRRGMVMKISSTKQLTYILICILVIGASYPIVVQTQLENKTRSEELKTIAIIPAAVDFYLGPPNLKKLFKTVGPDGLYVEPAIFKQRLDDESAQITFEINRHMEEKFKTRGYLIKLVQSPFISDETVANLQAEFSSALEADGRYSTGRKPTDSKSVHSTEGIARPIVSSAHSVRDLISADSLLAVRLWGWRKRGASLPAMGYTQSAAVLWVGLIDGKTGGLIWVGESNEATQLIAAKQGTKNLDKLIEKALKTFPIQSP